MAGYKSHFNDAEQAFDLDSFVGTVRSIVDETADAEARRLLIKDFMRATFKNPDRIASGMPSIEKDELVLHEDADVSIWFCRFRPDIVVPPHDHQMVALIGVYDGVELNSFYESADGALHKLSERRVEPGDVIDIDPDTIHTVATADDRPSLALHVYLGNLTTIDRSLFDWDSGAPIAFDQENFDRLERAKSTVELDAS